MSNRKTERALDDQELADIARHFKLLGEPMRLKILQSVCRRSRTVGDIVAATGATQANISKHLALLAAAGMVTREKDGQNVYYGVKAQLTVKLCELVRAQGAD